MALTEFKFLSIYEIQSRKPNILCFLNDSQRTFKKEILKDEHFDVARTRKCAECGSNEEMRWLALHPSYKHTYGDNNGAKLTLTLSEASKSLGQTYSLNLPKYFFFAAIV